MTDDVRMYTDFMWTDGAQAVTQLAPFERIHVRIRVDPVKVRVTDGVVRWRVAGKTATLPGDPDALRRFCRLRRGEESEIAKYSERWGTLGEVVRKRFAPAEASRAALRAIQMGNPQASTPFPFPRIARLLGDEEPVWLWRVVAAKTRALAILCVALVGERPELEQPRLWEEATVDGQERKPGTGMRLRDRRLLLELLLEDWFHIVADVQHRVELNAPSRPDGAIKASGAIGAAMSAVWVGVHLQSGLALCAMPRCSEPFLPMRKPAAKRLTFCPEHRGKGRALMSKWKLRGVPAKYRGGEYEDGQAR